MAANDPLRVLWVLPSLAGGGAERAVATLLTHLDRASVQPHLALFRAEGPFLAAVANQVPLTDLSASHRLDPRLMINLAQTLRRLKPAVTVAVLRYCSLLTTLAYLLAGRPGRLVINEQNHPSQEMALYGGAWFKRPVMRWAYQRADRVVAISKGIRTDLIDNFGITAGRVTIISNPVADAAVRRLGQGEAHHPWLAGPHPVLVSVGRLHPQKGFDLLLQALARLQAVEPEARLIIVGEGPQRTFLEQEIQRLGLAERVALVGFQDNPYRYMAHATLFVLPSRYEGFGIVLAEALTLGVPVVATDCPGGVAEVLAGGQAGVLVPVGDETALAGALQRLMEDEALQNRLRRAGPAQAQKYAARTVAQDYTKLLEQLSPSCVS